MKLVTPNRLNNESGSVLATTLIITFVIGATLASFLVLTQNQTFANARSQSWNQSMAVTEAGVEDAMQMINKYNFDPTRLLEWSQDADNLLDGWQPFGTDAYRTFRWVGTDYRAGYYVVISNANPIAPNITAWGYLRYDYEFAKAPIATAAAGTTFAGFNSRYLTRQVYVNTRKDALWTLAMLADRQIDLNGNNISTDSFNSADTGASTYDVSKGFAVYALADRRDKGDVATNYRIVNSLNVGNADIMGTVSTGPGGSVAIGPNGAVGDETWVLNNNGIQDGASRDDMNVKLNPVSLPGGFSPFSLPTLSGAGTNINGVAYKHVILTGGDYEASTLSGSVYIAPSVSSTVRIHLKSNVSLTGSDQIYIAEGAERLEIYMSGQQFKLAGNGVVNNTGRAESFLYFGLPTNTDLRFQGNGDFTGAIYAPNANFTLGGGGSSVQDFIGASVTRSVTMNGHYKFHYDEDLANFGPSRGFIPTSWAEK